MFKGLCVCYAVIAATFFSVAISGYWAFGNQAKGLILTNFLDDDGKPLVPKWFILMTNLFTILQLSAVAVVSVTFFLSYPSGVYLHLCQTKCSLHILYESKCSICCIVGLLTANKWSTRTNICRPKEQWILCTKCRPTTDIALNFCRSSHHDRSNAAIFRRY